MESADFTQAAAGFDPLRPTLIRVAYRMLGSVAHAEDIVQDAFIRWMEVDRSQVRVPEAFLRRMVMRMCLDELKSARHQRETYIGPWLPDPVVEEDEQEDVTLPLMLALERLSPLERAAFLLHDVFGLDFDEVAATLQREPAACRQLAARARTHVRESRPRFHIEKQRGLEIAQAFFAASRRGDASALGAMLAACSPSGSDEHLLVLNRGNGSDVKSLDPAFIQGNWEAWLLGDVIMGLTTEGPRSEPIPGAATGWDVSADGLTWTFHLRKHVWSDGAPVTAADFVTAWRRELDPRIAAPYAYNLWVVKNAYDVSVGKLPPAALGIRAKDDATLVVQLEHPAPYLAELVDHQVAWPIPRTFI